MDNLTGRVVGHVKVEQSQPHAAVGGATVMVEPGTYALMETDPPSDSVFVIVDATVMGSPVWATLQLNVARRDIQFVNAIEPGTFEMLMEE